jgi:hypothetical protein
MLGTNVEDRDRKQWPWKVKSRRWRRSCMMHHHHRHSILRKSIWAMRYDKIAICIEENDEILCTTTREKDMNELSLRVSVWWWWWLPCNHHEQRRQSLLNQDSQTWYKGLMSWWCCSTQHYGYSKYSVLSEHFVCVSLDSYYPRKACIIFGYRRAAQGLRSLIPNMQQVDQW